MKITEDYVSYEVAKLLKEKGFPQEYDIYYSMVYNEEDYEDEYEVQRMILETRLIKAGTLSSYPIGVPEPKCYCPTHQMAMAWLREVHKIHIEISVQEDNKYMPFVYKREGFRRHWRDKMPPIPLPSSYEEAVEAALKYSLENLI